MDPGACLLAAVFAARSGAPPLDPRMVTPPPQLDGLPRSYVEKGIFGQSFRHHVETENFTLQWTDSGIDPDRAVEIGEALERAWQELVVEGGWTPPVSSDEYLLWVILDPSLAGSGYTTEYVAGPYPDGYPITYLHPTIYEDEFPGYALSVAAHEFGHMLQYATAEYDSSGEQTWYWEATAEWLAEVSLPEVDTYALSSYWYARGPELAFDSIANGHAYGMFLLNAYLDEHVFGIDGIRRVWEAAGPNWHEAIADEAELPFSTVMHDFVGAYAAGALAESAIYDSPLTPERFETVPESESLRLPALYGVQFIEVADYDPALGVWVEGPVDLIAVQGGDWDVELEAGPVLFAAMATDSGQEFQFGVLPEVHEDTGAEKPQPTSCACAGAPGTGSPYALGLMLLALRRRRSAAMVTSSR